MTSRRAPTHYRTIQAHFLSISGHCNSSQQKPVFANILLSLPFCKTISISSLDLRVPANLIHVSLAFYLIALFTIVVCTNLYRYVRHNSCMLKAVSRIFPKFITMLVLLDYVLLLLIKCLFGFLDTLQHFPSKKVRSCQAD